MSEGLYNRQLDPMDLTHFTGGIGSVERNRPAGVIILAGGFGTRLQGVLDGLPKPLAPVAGRPFVEWIVRHFAAYGFEDFVLSTGHLGDLIEEHFSYHPVPGVHVTCVREFTPLGTAGGARNALPRGGAGRPWLVVNGDSLAVTDPRPLLAPIINGTADATVLGLGMDDASRYGTLEFEADGTLSAFREKQPGAGFINAGVYAFTGRTLAALPDGVKQSFEYDVFPRLVADRRVRVTPADAPFLDIGLPETLAAADAFVAAHFIEPDHPIAA